MSGMAGNVSAFTTVWTYDIYRALIKKDASDEHYVNMGRWSTIVGVIISVGTAYLVMRSPASWITCRRCSASSSLRCSAPSYSACCGSGSPAQAASGGCFAGTLSSIGMWLWVKRDPSALQYIALSSSAKAHG